MDPAASRQFTNSAAWVRPQIRSSVSEAGFRQVLRFSLPIIIHITNAPWYVSNHTLHKDLKNPYITEVIRENSTKYFNKLENHTNPLLQPLLQPHGNRRIKEIGHQI
jgi:hypothetical protein